MKNRNILVVDDEALIRDMLKMALGGAGYNVLAATQAEEALQILAQEQIPVMFIDLQLDTMNGFELCHRIRKDSPDAIIYALSGKANLFEPHDFEKAGFNGYESKPIVLENLYRIVTESFERIDELAKTAVAIKRILIIDDDDPFRSMLRKMLEQNGYTILEASCGEDGCKLYSEQNSDLVITDIVMDGISGLETALNIKDENPEAKFIVMSGGDWYGADAEFEMAHALGALTLRKPFDLKTLLQAIEQLQN